MKLTTPVALGLSLTLAVTAAGLARADEPSQTSEAPPAVSSTPPLPQAADLAPASAVATPEWTYDGFGDGRRTMGRFGANLGRNLVGVVSGDNLKPFLVGVGVTTAGSFLDSRTQSYFGGRDRFRTLGDAGATLGTPGILTPIAGGLLVAGRASGDSRFRSATYDIAQAFLVNAAWTTALKYAVHRQRPDGSDSLSFPSGHTSNAFAWATVASHYYGPKVSVPAYLAAGLIGVSRLDKNVHHLSDVLAGAALGYVVGRTVVREDSEPVRHHPRVSLAPTVGPSGTGAGLGVSIDF